MEISLPSRHAVLRIEIKSRSLCGMHLFGQIWMRQDAGPNWHEIEPILAVHLLVLGAREAGSATHRQADVELLERILSELSGDEALPRRRRSGAATDRLYSRGAIPVFRTSAASDAEEPARHVELAAGCLCPRIARRFPAGLFRRRCPPRPRGFRRHRGDLDRQLTAGERRRQGRRR